MWDALRLDVRHSFRSLRRAPTFSVIVIVTLALAVGATTAVGSLLNALVFRTLAVPSPQQLVAALKEAGAADAAARALLANITDPARTSTAHRRTAAEFLASCQKAAATPGAIEGWLRHTHGQRSAIDEADTG